MGGVNYVRWIPLFVLLPVLLCCGSPHPEEELLGGGVAAGSWGRREAAGATLGSGAKVAKPSFSVLHQPGGARLPVWVGPPWEGGDVGGP